MDANGLKFWSFASRQDWRLEKPQQIGLAYCDEQKILRLADEGPAPTPGEDEPRATEIATVPSRVKDAMANEAFWDAVSGSILASNSRRGTVVLEKPRVEPAPTDLALGADDVLYAARDGGVDLIDLRGRWTSPARIDLAGFKAHKLAPAAGGGVWALDRDRGRIARLVGAPLRDGVFPEKNADVFTPVEPNPNPPRLVPLASAKLPAGQKAVAIACSEQGQVAVLAWAQNAPATAYLIEDKRLVARFSTKNLLFPTDIAWIGETGLALLATDNGRLANQAFVYDIVSKGEASPSGGIFPLIDARDEPFLNVPGGVPVYAVQSGGFLPLRQVSSVSYARKGTAMIGPIDSQALDSVWHRLYLECVMPEYCSIVVRVHADNRFVKLEDIEDSDWHSHLFGGEARLGEPAAAWLDNASELPNHPGLLVSPRIPGRAGLFSALIQRAGKAVRRLSGRYLWLQIEFGGNTHLTPQIAGLRVYAGRFSYRDRYLPALYHETRWGVDADKPGAATPQDFLDRFLALIEEPLTQIEGKIAQADLLTDPASAPAPALPWLGGWIGVALEETAITHKDRQILLAAPYTARMYGAVGGLRAALELETGGVVVRGVRFDPNEDIPRPGDLALAEIDGKAMDVLALAAAAPGSGVESMVLAGGGVSGGEIVVVEDFRMRRTFATILGADLADERDPLTLGMSASGNSFVGDTLFLGGETRREFLSLFADDPNMSLRDRKAIAAFFDALAWRVTVLVHDGVVPQDLARLQRVAEAATPAHVEVSVKRATFPFLVGVASLIGVDTYLAPRPPPRTVDIGRSYIGVTDFLGGEALLASRRRYASAAQPFAVIDGPETVLDGGAFTLSGRRSRAPSGGRIAEYVWTWNE